MNIWTIISMITVVLMVGVIFTAALPYSIILVLLYLVAKYGTKRKP